MSQAENALTTHCLRHTCFHPTDADSEPIKAATSTSTVFSLRIPSTFRWAVIQQRGHRLMNIEIPVRNARMSLIDDGIPLREVRFLILFVFCITLRWYHDELNFRNFPGELEPDRSLLHRLEFWGCLGLYTEIILHGYLEYFILPAELFFPNAVERLQDWVSFWYWYHVQDVAAEDLSLGWSVRGRIRICRHLVRLCWKSLKVKLGPSTSRYVLSEKSLCGGQEATGRYSYAPLQSSEIRLLRLHASPSRCGLPNCDIFSVKMTQDIAYRCLSYRWGSDDRSHSIMLNGSPFSVSQTLREFMDIYRRRSDNDAYLWIDQICINQDDIQEKSEQVSQMDKIYRQCEEVIVWLGGCSDSSIGRALHFFHAIQSSRGAAFDAHNKFRCDCSDDTICMLRHHQTSERDRKPHTALQTLFSNPYWSRAWIIQEIILPPRAKVLCGGYSVDYEPEAEGLLLQCYSRTAYKFSPDTKPFFDLMYMHAQTRLRGAATTTTTTKDQQGTWRVQDAVQLVKCEARDPRDKVFALQGLLIPEQRIRIDYTMEKSKVFQELLLALFRHYERTEIKGSAPDQSFDDCIDYFLREFGLPDGLEKVFYNEKMITWCLGTAYFARKGSAFYARGEMHSFLGMSMLEVVEYFYRVADNLENPRTRAWLASRGADVEPWPEARVGTSPVGPGIGKRVSNWLARVPDSKVRARE